MTLKILVTKFILCYLNTGKLLHGAIVRVGYNSNRNNPVCGKQIKANQKVEMTCNLQGRYLSIELRGKKSLQFCEVRAFEGRCEGEN